MELSQKAKEAIKKGSVKIRVVRSGMFQQLTFTVKKIDMGNVNYFVLSTDRQVDVSELMKIAEEIGLPVVAQNGRAFPKGTSAVDFAGV
jgi:5-methylthioribose kinase